MILSGKQQMLMLKIFNSSKNLRIKEFVPSMFSAESSLYRSLSKIKRFVIIERDIENRSIVSLTPVGYIISVALNGDD